DGLQRPVQREGFAPAGRPAGHGENRQTRFAQPRQGGPGRGRQRPLGGQGVVDVGQHTAYARALGQRPLVQGFHVRGGSVAQDHPSTCRGKTLKPDRP
ncbi:hypothetical protein RZS08_28655, partial [Arthrospira platensis SPKY1]|nr:hypothetical protein [Arthrospira platensis SPKY1]